MIKFTDLDDFQVVSTDKTINTFQKYEDYKIFKEIVKDLSTKEMIEKKWIKSKDDLSPLYNMFKNLNRDSLPLFRKSETSNDKMILLWLSNVTYTAKLSGLIKPFKKFEGLTKEDLKDIAQLSVKDLIVNDLPAILSEKGIILIYNQPLKGMKLDGVALRLDSGNPIIGLSIRHNRLDNFWFTLMHELAHIVLHYDKLSIPIIDDLDIDNKDLIERQANALAKESFVTRSMWRTCPAKYNSRNENLVIEFAKKLNIHPAIVAGLLRKDKNNYTLYNNLIYKFDLRKEIYD